MVIIPFTNYPAISKDITLDGEDYRFKFIWNTRGEYWTLTILDTEGVVKLAGIKLVLGYELINSYSHLDIPPGQLYVVDLDDNNKTKIGMDDFTNERNLQLIYAELSDFE